MSVNVAVHQIEQKRSVNLLLNAAHAIENKEQNSRIEEIKLQSKLKVDGLVDGYYSLTKEINKIANDSQLENENLKRIKNLSQEMITNITNIIGIKKQNNNEKTTSGITLPVTPTSLPRTPERKNSIQVYDTSDTLPATPSSTPVRIPIKKTHYTGIFSCKIKKSKSIGVLSRKYNNIYDPNRPIFNEKHKAIIQNMFDEASERKSDVFALPNPMNGFVVGHKSMKKRVKKVTIRTPHEAVRKQCAHCGSTEKTPEWRSGPYGSDKICNACGLFYKKITTRFGVKDATLLMRYRKEVDPSNRKVPQKLEIPQNYIEKFHDSSRLDRDCLSIE